MKKLTLIAGLVALAAVTKAQKAVLLKQSFLPKHTYSVDTRSGFNLEVNMLADPAKAKEGETQKIELRSNTEINLAFKSAQVSAEKNLPISMTLNKISAKTTLNGQEAPMPDMTLAGQSIDALIDADGKVRVDTATASQQVKEATRSMIGEVPGQIIFPDKKMKVGDTFVQNVPMNNLNLPNLELNKDYDMKVTYTLTAIKDNLAYFDKAAQIDINYSTDVKGRTIAVTAKGSATGKLVFNIAKSFPKNVENTIDMAYDMTADKDKIAFKAKITNNTAYTVSAN